MDKILQMLWQLNKREKEGASVAEVVESQGLINAALSEIDTHFHVEYWRDKQGGKKIGAWLIVPSQEALAMLED